MVVIVIPRRFDPKKGRFFLTGEEGEHSDRSLEFGDEAAWRAREEIENDAKYGATPDVPTVGVASRAFGTDLTLKEMRFVCDVLNDAIGATHKGKEAT